MKIKARTLNELQDNDRKMQLERGYCNIPKGVIVEVIDDNHITDYGTHTVVIYNDIIYYVNNKDLDFNVPRKIYILSNSYDGIHNIGKGTYYAIDDYGKVLCHQTCSDKRFAKNDLIKKNKNRYNKFKEIYGNFQVVYLGDDEMTLEELVELHNENYPNKEV